MSAIQQKYWFSTKRYGWGWGFPNSWKGWVVYVGYVVAIVAAVLVVPPISNPILFIFLIAVASLIFVVICWLKGEPPRWRWGDN